MYNINLIGAGKLGKSIGKLFNLHSLVNNLYIVNNSIHSAQKASKFIGTGKIIKNIINLPSADIYLFAVPDNQIVNCVTEALKKNISEQAVFVHFSGVMPSSIMYQKRLLDNIKVVSVHPVKSFANENLAVSSFTGTHCSIEGDTHACLLIKDIFVKFGAKVFTVDEYYKPIYHFGCTIASNYTVTLAHMAETVFKNAGLNKNDAHSLVISLMQNAIDNMSSFQDLSLALTGPVQRREWQTILLSWQQLAYSKNENLLNLSKSLAINTAVLAKYSNKDMQKLLSIVN